MGDFKTYYRLTKPGIVYGNIISAAAGYFLASHGHFSAQTFLGLIFGLSLVIAAAGVFNNYIDRSLDRQMQRTKKRALASGLLSVKAALVFGSLLAIAGFAILLAFTNRLAAIWAALGFTIYLAAYGFSKRRSVHSTLIGSLAGATPPVVGYLAVSNDFDVIATLLFLVMALWQMPHFYAIGIYRLNDYRTAGLPILPVKKGLSQTKAQILFYLALFTLAATALGYYADLPALATAGLFIVGVGWLVWGVWTLKQLESLVWARLMFRLSLIVVLAFSLIISIGGWLS